VKLHPLWKNPSGVKKRRNCKKGAGHVGTRFSCRILQLTSVDSLEKDRGEILAGARFGWGETLQNANFFLAWLKAARPRDKVPHNAVKSLKEVKKFFGR